ncbi:MAG: ornithine cyclodeaminase family protein [Pseudomonadota bacterium]
MVHNLNEAQVKAYMSPSLVIDAVEKAFRALAKQRAINLPRDRLRLPTGVAQHILQGALLDEGVVGYKAYTSSRQGNYFNVFLSDAHTGALKAIVEANALGQWRTGAASAIATKCMLHTTPNIIGVIGAGWQAEGQIRFLNYCYPHAEFRVYSRNMNRCIDWCRTLSQELQISHLSARPTVDEVTREADVIVTATTSSVPVINKTCLKENVHINAVGANALNRCEIPENVIRNAWCVVDQRETAQKECGDLLSLTEKGFFTWQSLPELGEVLEGYKVKPNHPMQYSVFESHGLGILDVAVAHAIIQIVESQSGHISTTRLGLRKKG